MKYLLILIIILFSSQAFSSANNNLFAYDEQKVQLEFKSVNELEAFVLENDGYDINKVKEINNLLLTTANISDEPKPAENKKWQLDWPSVAIGALGCIVIEGIAYVSLFIAVLSSY
jgi:hypothetical protein